MVLRNDADSLRRNGDDVEGLQSSRVLNRRGSDFLARTFRYVGPGRVRGLINDIEFDCAAPRGRTRAQWLDDSAGDILQLRHGHGRWLATSAHFGAIRRQFCAAEGLPATTLDSESAAWHGICAGRDASRRAGPPAAAARASGMSSAVAAARK